NSTVTTTGANAHGVALASGGSVTMSGGSINAGGQNASGLLLVNEGSVTLNDVQVASTGASITSQLSENKAQQITVDAKSDLTGNNGPLLLVQRDAGGTQGTVAVNLQSGSFAAGNVLDPDGKNRVVVNKDDNAHWAGMGIDQGT